MKEEFTTSARRWYDRDPILSSAMKTLEESDDDTQIKIALNLIKIITEHNISSSEYESVEDIVAATEDVLENTKKGRWYDLDSTLRTAITLLQNCPDAPSAGLWPLPLKCHVSDSDCSRRKDRSYHSPP